MMGVPLPRSRLLPRKFPPGGATEYKTRKELPRTRPPPVLFGGLRCLQLTLEGLYIPLGELESAGKVPLEGEHASRCPELDPLLDPLAA
jgi:hypothetical protein